MLARKIRNGLLSETDHEFTLDRVELDVSTATKLAASLKALREGEWARYRQALRDLPEQAGFPLEIEWPVAPGSGPREESDVQEETAGGGDE